MTLDLIFVGALMVAGVLGWLSGFWMQLMRLGVLICAYLLSGVLGRPIGSVIAEGFGIPPLIGMALGTFVAFLVLYMVLSTVGWSLLRRRRKRRDLAQAEKAARRKTWDSAVGCLFAMAKTGLILFFLVNALVMVEKRVESKLKNNSLGYYNSMLVKVSRDHNMLRGMHIPVVGDIESLSRLGNDPNFRAKVADDPKVQRVLNHPKIKGLLGDRSIVKASQTRDISALMANPRLNEALQDPEVRQLLSEIDLSKVE